MSRTFNQERTVVAEAYPGKNWAKKVMEMDDEEVHEIYVSIMFRRANEAKQREAREAKEAKRG